jgi:YfiH family protein
MIPHVALPGSALHCAPGGLPAISWPGLNQAGLDAYVTTRDGGVSTGPFAGLNLGLHVGDRDENVLTNRERVASALGASLDDMVFGEQVHRPSVTVVTAEHRGRGARSRSDALPATDALVTRVPGIVLAVLAADCVPLVLFDPAARVLACVHAGWRGTVRGVTSAAVATMRGFGSDPADVVAGIGPAVAPDRYQVGAEVVEQAEAAFGSRVGQVVRTDGSGRWTFDLWRANAIQLADAGVPESQVHVAALPTGPGTPFFSHRFEGPCGRFAAVARLAGAAS